MLLVYTQLDAIELSNNHDFIKCVIYYTFNYCTFIVRYSCSNKLGTVDKQKIQLKNSSKKKCILLYVTTIYLKVCFQQKDMPWSD